MSTTAALPVLETHRTLHIARGGRLNAWLGPALRGLAAGRLRADVCRQPVADQLGRWEHCAGCPLMAGCAYGETVEPDPPAGVRLAAGWESTARPLVVAPAYPAPEAARPGDRLAVRVLFIGVHAAAHAARFWDALRRGGADPGLGLGDDRVLFDLLPPDDPADALRPLLLELPLPPAGDPAVVERVRVRLTSPLMLSTTADRCRHTVTQPTFAELVRAGLRVLGPLFKCHAEPLPECVFGQVKAAAQAVPARAAAFREFQQVKSSHRTHDRWVVRGIVGEGEYGPVPAYLLPWLAAAGRVHVGTHRVAGAGGWRTEK